MKNLLEKLQELMPLAEAAAPGPWRAEMDYEDNWTPMILSDYGHIATVEDIFGGSSRQEDNEAYPDQMEDNAAFIVAARNVLTPENLTLLVAALEILKDEATALLSDEQCQGYRNNLRGASTATTFNRGYQQGAAKLALHLLNLCPAHV